MQAHNKHLQIKINKKRGEIIQLTNTHTRKATQFPKCGVGKDLKVIYGGKGSVINAIN